jgi:hypothetical protein
MGIYYVEEADYPPPPAEPSWIVWRAPPGDWTPKRFYFRQLADEFAYSLTKMEAGFENKGKRRARR